MLNTPQITQLLTQITLPGGSEKLHQKQIKHIYCHPTLVFITIEVNVSLSTLHANQLQQQITQILTPSIPHPTAIRCHIQTPTKPHQTQNLSIKNHPQIKNVIAVGSGKGGVGKSTIALNLALALHITGAKVGILDADIYGPSLPILLGTSQKPELADNQKIQPILAHGLQSISIGYLIDQTQAAIWRGPMVTQALKQLFFDVHWTKLDYLIIDLPPGTGDIQLTLAQNIPITGAVIIQTPQKLAKADALKGVQMFEKVNIHSLGIIENMSGFTCAQCGTTNPIFQHNAQITMPSPMLGTLPIDASISQESDDGTPTMQMRPGHPIGLKFLEIASTLIHKISERPIDQAFSIPQIKTQTTPKPKAP